MRNLTRWQRVGQYSVTSAPQGTFCLASTALQRVTAVGNGAVRATTYLDGEVRQSISDRDRAAGVADPQTGRELVQTPAHSGSLFTTYKLPLGIEIGYGLTDQGSFAINAPIATKTRQFRSDEYLIHRAFLAWTLAPGWTAQFNVQNFTDGKYTTGIRNNVTAATGVVSGGWATPGDRRQAVLSLFRSF